MQPSIVERRPLTAKDVDRAAAEIEAMGAVPALQDGFAVFDEGLVGVGWDTPSCSFSDLGPIAVLVPKPGTTLEERRALVMEGIERCCQELEDFMSRDRDTGQPGDVQEWNRRLQLLRAVA